VNEQPARACPALVIGGSAGALEPLRRLIADIPHDFPAAVFVATHVPATSVSALPHLLALSGALFATHAIDGAPIKPGRIIVAPPDHHVVLQDGVMRVSQGPMENNHRPSIDVLFRSAAASCSTGACGILLSGALDDGVAGVVAIHDAGGVAFVQDPDEAQFPDMPINAIATGVVDGVYRAGRLFAAVKDWLNNPSTTHNGTTPPRDEREAGSPSVLTIPIAAARCESLTAVPLPDGSCVECSLDAGVARVRERTPTTPRPAGSSIKRPTRVEHRARARRGGEHHCFGEPSVTIDASPAGVSLSSSARRL
jgi:hypothetical protein